MGLDAARSQKGTDQRNQTSKKKMVNKMMTKLLWKPVCEVCPVKETCPLVDEISCEDHKWIEVGEPMDIHDQKQLSYKQMDESW